MLRLSGLIAAPFSPMDEQGNLMLDLIPEMVRHYAQNKVRGAFIAGTTGEGASLSLEEKLNLMEAWGRHQTEALSTIMMLGGNALPEMETLSAAARVNGMDAVALISPYFFKPKTVDDLVNFCARVAAFSPNLPVYYYHIPALSGAYFSMESFLKLASKRIPNLAGIKFSHLDLMDFHLSNRFQDRRYNLLWGTDEALLAGLSTGAIGAVGSTYNYMAPVYHKVIGAFEKGNLAEAEEWQFKAAQIVQCLIKYGGGVAAGKAFMKLIGLDCGWPRAPLNGLDSKTMQRLRQDLTALGFFEVCSTYTPS